MIYNSHKHRIDLANARFLEIGDYCQITEGCVILAHDYSFTVVVNKYHDFVRKQRLTKIGNNVFIGMNSIILMGTEIGDNTIIGAGSVVSGKVEGNSVYAGVPARKICTLEEHYNRMKKDLEKSAGIYASKCNDFRDMGLYRCLFEEEHDFQGYVRQHKFNGMNSEALENLQKPPQKLRFPDVKEK